MTKRKGEELFQFPGRIIMQYKYAVGPAGSRFLTELRDNKKIMGVRCPNCNRVYVPPRSTCRECFSNLEEWVELPGRGTLSSYTVVHYSEPFHPTESPLIYGIIQLDGADTALPHLLGEVDPGNLRIGMRVEPVFKEKREGNILDISYFKPLPT